jgi:hypothetical protein
MSFGKISADHENARIRGMWGQNGKMELAKIFILS